jgi:hypothetical protein
MKRNVLIIACLFIATLSFGETNGKLLVKKPVYGLLSNGFYANLGVAYPTFGFLSAGSSSFGIEPHLEVGNQWYFTRNEYWGFGIKVSWLQAGFSQFNNGTLTPTTNLDFRFLKVAPQFSYIVSTNMALDVTFEVAPTLMYSANAYGVAGTGGGQTSFTVYGVMFAPGLRFRYKKYAIGGDFGFGTLNINTNTAIYNGVTTGNMICPRVYLGLQF